MTILEKFKALPQDIKDNYKVQGIIIKQQEKQDNLESLDFKYDKKLGKLYWYNVLTNKGKNLVYRTRNIYTINKDDFSKVDYKDLNETFKRKSSLNASVLDDSCYFYGNFGRGKTLLLHKILVKEAVKNNKQVAFMNIVSWMNKLPSTWKQEGKKNVDYEINERLKNVDILFLDDIGTEKFKEWFHIKKLFDVLSFRMDNKLRTYYSSNYNFKQLMEKYTKDYGNLMDVKRIMVRIATAKQIEIKDINWRSLK
jgi:DNA replication protein DnaC